MINFKRNLNTGTGEESSLGGAFAAIKADFLSDKFEGEAEKSESEITAEKAEAEKDKAAADVEKGLEIEKSEEEKKTESDKAAEEQKKVDEAKATEAEKNKGKSSEEIAEAKKQEDIKSAKEKEDAEKDIELTLGGDNESDENADKTWADLAKAEGITIAEDNYDSFKKGIIEKTKAENQKEIEEAKQIGLNEALKDIKDPQARLIVEMAKTGMSVEEIIKPISAIEKAEKLSDIDLVRENYKLKGYTEDMIDKKVESLTEVDRLKFEADEIRIDLGAIKADINKAYSERLLKHEEMIKSQDALEKKRTADGIKTVLDTIPNFLEAKLPEKTRAQVLEKFKAGGYDKILKDSKFIANAILYHEFGETAQKALKTKVFGEGKDSKTKDLHNIPGKKTGASRKSEPSATEKKGAFQAMKDDLGHGDE